MSARKQPLTRDEIARSFQGAWGERFPAILSPADLSTPGTVFQVGVAPNRIDVINKIFTPSPAEIDYAQRVVAAFDGAQARGDGAVALGDNSSTYRSSNGLAEVLP